MKTDFRPLYRGFARGLALGAFPGLGPAEPNFPIMQPVFDFANIAMKLSIVQEPMAAWPNSNNMRASIWAGINRVMIASYNTSRKPLEASLDIDLPLLVREYGYTGKLDMDSITIFNASTGTRAAKGFIVQKVENGHVKISGKLGANELLLIYAR
jgi:hypothetical protein